MTRAALLFSLVLFACSKEAPPAASPTPTPTPIETEPPPADLKPELVELESDSVPADCVAPESEGGVLDRTSPAYSKIEFKENKQFVEETAWMRDSGLKVVVGIGGCAHYGVHFQINMKGDRAMNKEAAVRAAFETIKKLPKREGVDYFLPTLETALSATGLDFETCHFPQGEITSVMCGVSPDENNAGELTVALGVDNAL